MADLVKNVGVVGTELSALQGLTWWNMKLNRAVGQNRRELFFFMGIAAYFSEHLMFLNMKKPPWRLWNVNSESSQTSYHMRQTSTSAHAVYRNLKILSWCTVFVWNSHVCFSTTTNAHFTQRNMVISLPLSLINFQDLITDIHQS